jgi:Sec-independent protein translocase protein TatA
VNLFGIGPLELLFILVIALVIVGPKELGSYARSAGRFLNRLYRSETWRMLTEASQNLRTLPNRLAREAALEELDETQRSLRATGDSIRDDLRELNQDLRAWMPPPVSDGSADAEHGGDPEHAAQAGDE